MINLIFLQQPKGGFGIETMIMLGLMIVVFYFFMIRPQQKKAKDQKTFRDNIKKGDTVVTIGGAHGKVVSIEADDTVIIEIAAGVRVKFEKAAISMESSKKFQTESAK